MCDKELIATGVYVRIMCTTYTRDAVLANIFKFNVYTGRRTHTHTHTGSCPVQIVEHSLSHKNPFRNREDVCRMKITIYIL